MKDFLSFSSTEFRNLKIGLLVLAAILLISNIRPASEGIAELPIWQPKGRTAERTVNFKAPPGYTGNLNDLGVRRFVTLDALIVIYKDVAGRAIHKEAAAEIHQAVHLAREFFWRNTSLQLNIRPTFLEVEGALSEDFISENGGVWPKSGLLEEDLLARGVKKNEYDLVFLFYPRSSVGDVHGSGMVLKRLGKSGYSFAGYPLATADNPHPDGPAGTWIFSRELWYSINTIVYDRDTEKIEDWGALAGTLRQYSIQDPPKPYGKIYLTVDSDRDGVPDDEPMVPFYEVSLGLNRETRDSDGDGLEDMSEITAGIFRGADLFLQDTDGDGLKDGEDSHPLDPGLPVKVSSDD